MMKRDCRLNHCLEEQLLVRTNLAHPALFPNIVCSMKLAGVIQIDAGNVFNGISGDVFIGVVAFSFAHTTRMLGAHASSHARRNNTTAESRAGEDACAPPSRRYREINREAMTFAAVAPAPTALLIVGDAGFETSPAANTKGTLVSCSLFTEM